MRVTRDTALRKAPAQPLQRGARPPCRRRGRIAAACQVLNPWAQWRLVGLYKPYVIDSKENPS